MAYSISDLKEMILFCKQHRVVKFQLGQANFEFQPTAFISEEVDKAVKQQLEEKLSEPVNELGLTASEEADLVWSSETPVS